MQKRFFIQMLIVMVSAILGSSLYYWSICHSLRKTREGAPGKLNQILYDSTRYDAVFVGTSRVFKNINPLQFDSITSAHSYNAGIDGANLTLIDVLTRRFIKGHQGVRHVFINLDSYTMEKDSSFFYFPQFFPHLSAEGMNTLQPLEPKLSLGNHYPFYAISYLDDYLKGVAFHTLYDQCPACDTTFMHRGFAPIVSADYQGSSEEFSLDFIFTTNGFKKLDSLCAYCTEQHCSVFFIMAPMYNAKEGKGSNPRDFYTQLRAIEDKYNIKELNFYLDKSFGKDMFFNRTHLNKKGAAFYTQVLADSFARYK